MFVNIKKISSCFILLAMLCTITGCARNVLTKSDILETRQDHALAILHTENLFDGKAPISNMSYCTVGLSAAEGEHLDYRLLKNFKYYVVQTSASKLLIDRAYCSEFRVMFAKERSLQIDPPLEINLKSGKINYAGKIITDYKSADLKPHDLMPIINAATPNIQLPTHITTERTDETSMKLQVKDDYEFAKQQYFNIYEELPDGFEFKKTLITNANR